MVSVHHNPPPRWRVIQGSHRQQVDPLPTSPSLCQTASICHKGPVKDLNIRGEPSHYPQAPSISYWWQAPHLPLNQVPTLLGGEVKHPIIQLTKFKDLYLGEWRLSVFYPYRPGAYAEDMIPGLQGSRGAPTVSRLPGVKLEAILPQGSMANSGSACPSSHRVAARCQEKTPYSPLRGCGFERLAIQAN